MAHTVKPTYTGSEKLITSEVLGENFVEFNKLREKKVYDKLFVKEHYEYDALGTLTIVDTGLALDQDTQVELDVVKANLLPDDVHNYVLGETVSKIPEKEIYMKESDLAKETDLLDFDVLL